MLFSLNAADDPLFASDMYLTLETAFFEACVVAAVSGLCMVFWLVYFNRTNR